MYELKNEVYFKASRMDLISLIPKNSENKILEVGMGGGNTLLTIKELNLAAEVVGVELIL
jgi:tRNA G46 methylase TrmB